MNKIRAIAKHPLSQGLLITSLSTGVLVFKSEPSSSYASSILLERCAKAINQEISISQDQVVQLQALSLQNSVDEVGAIVGTPFCKLSNRMIDSYGSRIEVTPHAYPIQGTNRVLLVYIAPGRQYAGWEFWDLPTDAPSQVATPQENFEQNWQNRYQAVSSTVSQQYQVVEQKTTSFWDFLFGSQPSSNGCQ